MADISKISPDDGSTILNIKDSNAVHWADNTILGAKNIIPKDSRRDTSKSQNGVSWILNADDTVTGTTNGVASTGESRFTITGYIPFTDSLIKKNKAYKISAEVPADAPNNVRLEIALWRDASTYDGVRYYQDKTSEETEFTITSATANGYSLYILVPSGTTISSPITFKPMIRLASDTDKTYQSPTYTNNELTKAIKPVYTDIQSAIAAKIGTQTGYTLGISQMWEDSQRVDLCIWLSSVSQALSLNWDLSGVIPKAAQKAGASVAARDGNKGGVCWVNNNAASLFIRIPTPDVTQEFIVRILYYKA